ncbi:MAG: tetratricopeptide repeat protein [Bacteroidota bacterium]
MKKIILFSLLSLLVLTFSCKQDQSLIQQLEKTYQESPTKENLTQLLSAYVEQWDGQSSWSTESENTLNRILELNIENQSGDAAIDFLLLAMKQYPDQLIKEDRLEYIAEVYEQELNDPTLSGFVEILKNIKFNNQQEDTEVYTFDILKQTVDTSGNVNFTATNQYIMASRMHATILPQDSLSPQLLFKAADVAQNTRTYATALELLESIQTDYPDHPIATQALFLNGFILDDKLKRFDEAREKYQAFIDQYPDDPFVESAQFLLDNLGVPKEDIIERFEEKNKEGE